MTKENLLVTLADKNYIDQAKQLFSSVYWNAGWKGDYMLLAHEIPEKDLKWFRKKGILIKKCKALSKKGWGSWPPTLLNKFYLFTPEFKKWKNVIYLDADIIVRASLDELTKLNGFFAISHSETIINNFRNMKMSSKKDIKKMIYWLRKEGYNIKKPFFNGGVLVFSTDIIKEDTFDKLVTLRKILDSEERILNIHFYKKWESLPLIYNVHINILKAYNFLNEKINGTILHFASEFSEDKPWNEKNSFYDEWKYNLKRAELINLDKIPEVEKGTKTKSCKNSLIIQLYYRKIYLIYHIDRIFGQIGLFIKKKNPSLYHKLKRIEKKIRK